MKASLVTLHLTLQCRLQALEELLGNHKAVENRSSPRFHSERVYLDACICVCGCGVLGGSGLHSKRPGSGICVPTP